MVVKCPDAKLSLVNLFSTPFSRYWKWKVRVVGRSVDQCSKQYHKETRKIKCASCSGNPHKERDGLDLGGYFKIRFSLPSDMMLVFMPSRPPMC